MPAERHLSIDALRGVAVLGILPMNIVGIGLPSYAYVSPAHAGGDGGANLVAWALAHVLVDGKMRTLFALLFGASLVLMAARSEGCRPGPATMHYRRMAWLCVFGMLHAWLVWYGDILVTYALAGCLAYPLRRQRARRLIGVGLGILALLVCFGIVSHVQLSQLRAAAQLPGAALETVAAWHAVLAQIMPPDAIGRTELAGYRGDFVDALRVRAPMTLFFQTRLMPMHALWEALGVMLVGMGLFRLGLLTGQLSTAVLARIGAVLVLVGIVLGAQLATYLWSMRWDPLATLVADAVAVPIHLAMALGYAAAVIAWARSGMMRGVVERLATCGRMALSNYLGANIVATTIFYGYGLGVYGRLERAELYLVVLVIWVVQLGMSRIWLERFRLGPCEWAWRSLARWQVQPMRLAPVASRAAA